MSAFFVVTHCLPQINNPRWQKQLQDEPSTIATPLRKLTELELEQNKNAR